LAARNHRIAGIDRELRCPASELPDLRSGKPQLLKKQRAPITLDRADVHQDGLSGAIEHLFVVRIQLRSNTAAESERPAEVLRRSAGFRCTPQPDAKSP